MPDLSVSWPGEQLSGAVGDHQPSVGMVLTVLVDAGTVGHVGDELPCVLCVLGVIGIPLKRTCESLFTDH